MAIVLVPFAALLISLTVCALGGIQYGDAR